MAAKTNAYDEVPYQSYPFPDSHPDRLATVARLFGLRTPDITGCRVLELGAASGGNLIPMAETLPGSTFVGVDYSATQVNHGCNTLAELGLKNIELRHASITDVDASYGKFDYVICHGVYSWVPDAVQDAILRVSKQNLTPTGVAYVSYNTLPGWHMRGMIRDMMRYHASRFGEPNMRIGQARALLDFLFKAVGDVPTNAYSQMLKQEVQMVKDAQDWYLYHEHLEENNSPMYFHQFVERAQQHGLRFLGESHVRQMVPGNYPKETEEVLQRLSNDIVHMEQYMDFLRNRMFRQTLLCHADQQPSYSVSPDRLEGLYVGTQLRPESATPDLGSAAPEKFQVPNGNGSVTVSDPLAKHALMILAEAWPAVVSFEQVVREARNRATPNTGGDATYAQDAQTLGRMFLQFLMSMVDRLVDIRSRPLPVATKVPEKPKTLAMTRFQAKSGVQAVNLRHELGNFGEFERHLLQRLDGARTRDQVVDELAGLVENGTLSAKLDNQTVTDPAQVRQLIGQAADQALARMAEFSYLVQ